MAHNPSMNNQQQHSMMNSNQRGLSSPNQMYQIQSSNMSQRSHLQQQPQQSQMMSGYSSPKPTDISARQFSPTLTNINGSAYQPLGGSPPYSNFNVDNSQMNIHHHNQNSSHQYNQPQHYQHQSTLQQQHYQQSNTMNQHQHQIHPQSQKQQVPQQLLQSHQYNMHQGNQQNHQQVAPSQHSPIKAIHHQQPQHQSRQQPYIHIQQRNSQPQQQQQPKYDRIQQPRRILQNTNSLNHRPLAKDPVITSDLPSETNETVEPTVKDVNAVVVCNEDNSDAKEIKSEVEKGEQEITEKSDSASENKELANTKEKTPMTLVQELAKFNKIERKYTLLDEEGPAHKKTFHVKLQLAHEEYTSSGASIRKAQQSAAAIALKETQFKHPPQKPAWRARKDPKIGEDGKLTPTVELNGLAMKRGEAAIYKPIEPQQPPYYYPPGMDPRAMYSQRYYQYMRASRDPRYARYWPMRYHYPRMSRAFYVSLRVGHREFIGDGPTRQSARHNAALKALKVLRNLPEEEVIDQPEDQDVPEEEDGVDDPDGLKSRVTSVHEIAFRRKMAVNFEVIRESGPPHMKTFVTRCTVGDLVSDGEGNSKKMSKKIAAEDMYEKLKALGSLPPSAAKPKPKLQVHKRKNRIKAEIHQQKADPNYGVGVNAISRLIQIMCAQKKKEPVYTLVTERGVSSRKEFIMQIQVEDKTCTGSGPNKKLAKRAAAEAMVELLGYNKPTPQPAKSSFKQPSIEGQAGNNGEKKVTFSENCQRNESNESKASSSNVSGHVQKVPGLLHLPSKTMVTTPAPTVSSSSPHSSSPQSSQKDLSLVNLSSILKPNWRPELQLRELCKALKFPMEVHDFSKTNQSNNTVEYMARIDVGPLENIQNFIASSNSAESARDMACMEALKVLVSKVKDMHPAGDGSAHLKKSVLSRTSSGMREISQ